MPKKESGSGEIENQLSWSCVCLYQPWPWQDEEFPETLRKGLSHIQCHTRAGQEAEKERRGELRGVPSSSLGGREGWDSKVTEKVFLFRGKLRNLILSRSSCVSLIVSVSKRWGLSVECVSQEEEEWMGSVRKREGYPAAILHGLITGNQPRYARHIYATTQSPHPKPLAGWLTSSMAVWAKPDNARF